MEAPEQPVIHPDAVTLLDYTVGELVADSADVIRLHVNSCKQCQERIVALSCAIDEIERLPHAAWLSDAVLAGQQHAPVRHRRGAHVISAGLFMLAAIGALILFDASDIGRDVPIPTERQIVLHSMSAEPADVVSGLLSGISHKVIVDRSDPRHLIVLLPDAEIAAASARLRLGESADGLAYVIDLAGGGTTLVDTSTK